jgi:hypothetical protein
MKTSTTVGLIILVVFLVLGSVFGVLFATGSLSTTGQGTSQNPSVTVQALNTQTVTFSAANKYVPTTSVTTTYTYFQNDVKSGADTTGSLSVGRGLDYEVFANASGYVADSYAFTGSADPMKPYQFELGQLMNLSNVLSFKNDDSTTNAVANTYAMGTGQSVNIGVKLNGETKKVFPGGVIVFEANNSAYDSIDFNLGTSTSVPDQYSSTSTGNKNWAFTFPAITGNELKLGTVTVTAKDSVNPTNTSNIAYTIYDAQKFIDSKTGKISGPAVEDSDNKDIGAAQITGTIYIS